MTLVLLFVTLITPPTEVAFRIADPELVPEGIAYDPATKRFFVGSTFKRKIVAVDTKGRVTDFTSEAQDALFGMLGLRVDAKRRLLWAISSNAGGTMPSRNLDKTCLGCSTVTTYNLDTGKLVRKYELSNKPGVHFLNDVVVSAAGDAFITDTITGDLYRIRAGSDALERWINIGEQVYPNGIDIADDQQTLFVATGAGIRRVSISDGRVTPVQPLDPAAKPPIIDGMYFHKGSLIAIQPFEEKRTVVRYRLSADGSAVTAADVLQGEHALHKQPTTGVIVGSDLYYIANAQLQVFRAMYKDGAYDKSALVDIVVLRTPIPK